MITNFLISSTIVGVAILLLAFGRSWFNTKKDGCQ
jgi:hypothetical protein